MLPESVRQPAEHFLVQAQRDDGGFAGRDGPSDLYYTSFALRALAALGCLEGEIAARSARYLSDRLGGHEPIVDFLSLIFSATLLDNSAGIDIFSERAGGWTERIAVQLEVLRRNDGGYARSSEGRRSSTYQSFLTVLALQMLSQPIPSPNRVSEFILSQRREDGGFIELQAMRSSGTNPTAAAIAVLRILRETDEAGESLHDVSSAAARFLVERQTAEGGLAANTRIPTADLLSTFTGALTLNDLGHLHHLDTAAALEFVFSLHSKTGGFHAAPWDDAVDVEYTYYGLAAMSLLHHARRAP